MPLRSNVHPLTPPDRLQMLVDRLASRRRIPHAVMAIETGDGRFRWSGAAGQATPDGRPMHAGTPFFIASIDKLFIASAVLYLHERGRVRLDEPILAYLPQTLVAGLHRLRGTDHSAALTVRHLLGHTSGLPDWLEDHPTGGRSLVDRLVGDGDASWSLERMTVYVRERLTPHFPPQPAATARPKVRYSDTNYKLLIAIVEAVTGTPLHQVYEELIFRRLDLRQTWLPGYSQPIDPAPAAAVLWAGDRPLEIPLMMRSLQAVHSTAGDLIQFLRGLLQGRVFDSPATLALMQQHWHRFGLPRDRAALRSPGWPIEYGLGMMRFYDPFQAALARLPRVLRFMTPVPAVVGHTGSTGSWLFYCPELDLFLAGTVDQATAGAVPFRFVPRVLTVMTGVDLT